MGRKQDELARLLGGLGNITKGGPRPRLKDIKAAGFVPEVEAACRGLGGSLATCNPRAGAWDVEFDGVVVELDEQLHFNRYRASTLDSPLYARLPRFPLDAYRERCRSKADRCLAAGAYGGKWSNPSSARQFGAASIAPNLTGGGAPRWKQRAFYDFIKDLAPITIGLPMARISIGCGSAGATGRSEDVAGVAADG